MNADRGSATARLIAAATVMRAEQGGRGTGVGAAPDGAAAWCERFLSDGRADRLLLWSVRSALGKAWWRFVESVSVPGIVSHWMRRKREIDRLARRAASEGFTQLIVLGAGLDALAFRLAHERLYERILAADHPATLAVIRAAACRAGDSEAHGVQLLALDLAREDACRALGRWRAYDPARATLVVIEGVLMYLPEPTVARILGSLAKLPAARLRLIASWMAAEPGEPIGFGGQSRVVAAWLRRRQEPMLWASTHSALPAFLSRLGWGSARLIGLSERDGCVDGGGLAGELLAVAERCGPQ